MRTFIAAVALLAALASPAAAEKPKLLVLPLAPAARVDAAAARMFDARLLVALDDARRVQTITHDEEPECRTLTCLAELGTKTGAAYVLALSAVREGGHVTLFGTLVDARTAAAWRRIELRVAAGALAKTAPRELVPQILGPSAGPRVLAFAAPASDLAGEAARALAVRLPALRRYRVLPPDVEGSRAIPTHRAEVIVRDLAITETRRHICTWLEAKLVATLAITDLATGRIVLSRTVDLEEARRKHFSSRRELREVLVDRAVDEWTRAVAANRPRARK